MDVPLVSIVIPTYNYGQYIRDAIESGLRQTYQNVEIIVIDDGSDDSTRSIVEEYGGSIRYFFKENGGLSSARNRGVEMSRGEYVAFLDSDDKLHETYIERCLDHLRQQAPNIGFVFTQQHYFEGSDITTRLEPYNLRHLKRENTLPAACLIRSEFAKEFRYDVQLKVLEDWDFFLTLAENGIYGCLLDEPLFSYRIHLDRGSMLNRVWLRDVLKVRHGIIAKHCRLYGKFEFVKYGVLYYAHESIFKVRESIFAGDRRQRGITPLG